MAGWDDIPNATPGSSTASGWDAIPNSPGGASGSFPQQSTMGDIFDTYSSMLKNVPGDIKDIAKGIYETGRHPIKTVKGMGALTAGMLETIFPGPVDLNSPEKQAFKTLMQPIAEAVKNPSEIPARLSEYTENHPLKALLNLSIGLGGAGKIADLAGLPKAAETVSGLSEATNPMTYAGKIAGYPIAKVAGIARQGIPGSVAAKYNIPTTLGEDIGNPTLQRAETILEKVPLTGIRKFRVRQLQAAQAAAQRMLAKYVVPGATPEEGMSLAATNRAYVDTLYENMKKVAHGMPQNIDPKATRIQSRILLKRYPNIFKRFQDEKLEADIQNIASGTKPTITKTSPILDASGKPIVTKTPNVLSFDDMWTLRDGLGDLIGMAKKKLRAGDVNKTEISQLNSLYKAINDDLDSWAQKAKTPQLRGMINSANDAYKTYVVKYRLMQEAYDKATGVKGAREMFSPKNFSTELKNIAYKDREIGVFKPGEIKEMTGFANILQVLKRAGQFAENPPTGNRFLDLFLTGGLGGGLAAGMITNPAATGITIGSYGTTTSILKFLTTTEKGKALCKAASVVEPDSDAMAFIVKTIANDVGKPAYVIGGLYNGKKITDIGRDDNSKPIALRLHDGSEVSLPY